MGEERPGEGPWAYKGPTQDDDDDSSDARSNDVHGGHVERLEHDLRVIICVEAAGRGWQVRGVTECRGQMR